MTVSDGSNLGEHLPPFCNARNRCLQMQSNDRASGAVAAAAIDFHCCGQIAAARLHSLVLYHIHRLSLSLFCRLLCVIYSDEERKWRKQKKKKEKRRVEKKVGHCRLSCRFHCLFVYLRFFCSLFCPFSLSPFHFVPSSIRSTVIHLKHLHFWVDSVGSRIFFLSWIVTSLVRKLLVTAPTDTLTERQKAAKAVDH